MTRKDYETFAVIIGCTLARAVKTGGEDFRTEIYDSLYRPAVTYFAQDNPRFDNLRFAEAVGRCELRHL